ncbi:unnamed protein product, partial [Polarella glacialis]
WTPAVAELGYTFESCCYPKAEHCFDSFFTFERCCLLDSSEIFRDLAEFRSPWPVLERVAAAASAGFGRPPWTGQKRPRGRRGRADASLQCSS